MRGREVQRDGRRRTRKRWKRIRRRWEDRLETDESAAAAAAACSSIASFSAAEVPMMYGGLFRGMLDFSPSQGQINPEAMRRYPSNQKAPSPRKTTQLIYTMYTYMLIHTIGPFTRISSMYMCSNMYIFM